MATIDARIGGDYKAQYMREVNACSNRILDKLGVRRELQSETNGAPKATSDYTSQERKGLEEMVWRNVSDVYKSLFTAPVTGSSKVYSGLNAEGSIFLVAGENNIPKDGTLLFTGKPRVDLSGYDIERVSDPNIDVPYLSAIGLRARALNDAEKNAFSATEVLGNVNPVVADPTKPVDLGRLNEEKQNEVGRLSEAHALGALPAVLVNYWNGQAMPMQIYASMDENGKYCVVDPLTERRGMGANMQEAILDLAKSGAYPECAIYYKGLEWDKFNNKFKPDVCVVNATIGGWSKFANTTDMVMGGVGYSALAMSFTGVGEIPAAVAGVTSTGWFGYRAVENFVNNIHHKKILFDPKNPEDWREAGMLLASVFTKGKVSTGTRITGIGMMAGADVAIGIEAYGQMVAETGNMPPEEAKNAWKKFWLANGGQLAASLALNLFFMGREVSMARVPKKIGKVPKLELIENEEPGKIETASGTKLGFWHKTPYDIAYASNVKEIKLAYPKDKSTRKQAIEILDILAKNRLFDYSTFKIGELISICGAISKKIPPGSENWAFASLKSFLTNPKFDPAKHLDNCWLMFNSLITESVPGSFTNAAFKSMNTILSNPKFDLDKHLDYCWGMFQEMMQWYAPNKPADAALKSLNILLSHPNFDLGRHVKATRSIFYDQFVAGLVDFNPLIALFTNPKFNPDTHLDAYGLIFNKIFFNTSKDIAKDVFNSFNTLVSNPKFNLDNIKSCELIYNAITYESHHKTHPAFDSFVTLISNPKFNPDKNLNSCKSIYELISSDIPMHIRPYAFESLKILFSNPNFNPEKHLEPANNLIKYIANMHYDPLLVSGKQAFQSLGNIFSSQFFNPEKHLELLTAIANKTESYQAEYALKFLDGLFSNQNFTPEMHLELLDFLANKNLGQNISSIFHYLKNELPNHQYFTQGKVELSNVLLLALKDLEFTSFDLYGIRSLSECQGRLTSANRRLLILGFDIFTPEFNSFFESNVLGNQKILKSRSDKKISYSFLRHCIDSPDFGKEAQRLLLEAQSGSRNVISLFELLSLCNQLGVKLNHISVAGENQPTIKLKETLTKEIYKKFKSSFGFSLPAEKNDLTKGFLVPLLTYKKFISDYGDLDGIFTDAVKTSKDGTFREYKFQESFRKEIGKSTYELWAGERKAAIASEGSIEEKTAVLGRVRNNLLEVEEHFFDSKYLKEGSPIREAIVNSAKGEELRKTVTDWCRENNLKDIEKFLSSIEKAIAARRQFQNLITQAGNNEANLAELSVQITEFVRTARPVLSTLKAEGAKPQLDALAGSMSIKTTQKGTYAYIESGSFDELFCCGKVEGESPCQAYDYPSPLKIGLVGYVELPWVKVVAIRREGSAPPEQSVARAMIKLVKDANTQKFKILVEHIYGDNSFKGAILQQLRNTYEPKGIEVAYIDKNERTGIEFLKSGRSDVSYSDALGGNADYRGTKH